MHEVGHTLGLRHNFRASRVYTTDAAGRPGVHAHQRHHRLGDGVRADQPRAPGRAPLRRAVPDHARALRLLGDRVRLQAAARRLARPRRRPRSRRSPRAAPSRSSPTAPTRTTSSASIPRRCSSTSATTPSASRRSASRSPATCFKRQETRQLPARPGLQPCCAARSATRSSDVGRAAGVLARQIGGVRTLRDFPGTGRDPLQPVPAADQREALDVIAGGLLAADSFARLAGAAAPPRARLQERGDALCDGEGRSRPTISPRQQVLDVQRTLLGRADERHGGDAHPRQQREGAGRQPAARSAVRALQPPVAAIWSELDGSGDITPLRRELQREHVNRISAAAAARRVEPRRRAQPGARPGQGAARADPRRRPAAPA